MRSVREQDRPGEVVVVVPARDEERWLPRCLAAVHVACAAAEETGVRTHVVVVADSCTDGTAAVARAAGVHLVEVRSGRLGGVRDTGVRHALGLAGSDPHRTWVASTDADSVVPPGWLRSQLALAALGADACAGTVRLAGAADGEPPAPQLVPVLQRWTERYQARVAPDLTHPHVHGANLGVRADAYLAVGGFGDLPLHEDQVLVLLLRAAGFAVVTSAADPVATSHRTVGRVRTGGVSTDLRTA